MEGWEFCFHISSTCYQVCNTFLIMHPAKLHIIYVHILNNVLTNNQFGFIEFRQCHSCELQAFVTVDDITREINKLCLRTLNEVNVGEQVPYGGGY